MKDFRELQVWRKAHQLTLDIYSATSKLPTQEIYGLTSQVRRAAVSIPSNIAEGCGCGSDSDFARFIQMALGSSSEVEYQLVLARDLHWLLADDYERLNAQVCEIEKMLTSLLQTLRK